MVANRDIGGRSYETSKAAVIHFTRATATDWAPFGITVNAICPGWVETEMAKSSLQAMADAQGITYDESKAQQEAILPAKRVSTPQEIAQWVDFLFSGLADGCDKSRIETYTGQALDVNSGSWMG